MGEKLELSYSYFILYILIFHIFAENLKKNNYG